MKRTIIKTICIFFTIVFCFVNAPVFNAIAEAENRYAANYGFPLVLTGNKNESGAVDINISLIPKMDNVESYVVNIRHWLSCGCIFYEHLKSEESTVFYDAEIGRKYKLSIELTSGENKRYVAGYLVANDSDGAISFDIDYDNFWDEQEFNEYLKTYIPISEDEYDEIYSKLDLPSFIDADNARESGHALRMDEFSNSLDTIGYYNIDGTCTVYTFTNPVRYLEDDGIIKDYSSDIQQATRSKESEGYKYSNRFGDVTVDFPDRMSNYAGTRLTVMNESISFGLFDGYSTDDRFLGRSSSASDLAKVQTRINKQSVRYDNTGTKEYTIECAPVINGAKASVVLESMPDDNRIQFWISADGRKCRVNDDGSAVYFASTENNTRAYKFGGTLLEDSNSFSKRMSVNSRISIIGANSTQVLAEVVLDDELLEAPLTVYPVKATVYLTFTDIPVDNEVYQDGEVSQEETAKETGENPTRSGGSYYDDGCNYFNYNIIGGSVFLGGEVYGSDKEIFPLGYTGVPYYNSSTCSYDPNEAFIFLKYNTSEIASYAEDNSITGAHFNLRTMYASGNNIPVYLKRVNQNWSSPSDLNPGFIGNVHNTVYDCIQVSPSSNPGNYAVFNVKELLKDQIRYNTNKGIRLNINSNNCLLFFSPYCSDTEFRPFLNVTYTPRIFKYRLRTTKAFLKLDYGEVYEHFENHLQFFDRYGNVENNIEVIPTSLNPDIATIEIDNGNILITANNSDNKGIAQIEITRADNGEKVYVSVDVSFHISLMPGVSQAVEALDNSDFPYRRDADIDYVITFKGKEWDYIKYDLNDDDNHLHDYEENNARKKANCNAEKIFELEELKYLYYVDLYGVLDYVRYESERHDNGSTLQEQRFNMLKYKNDLFTVIFGRAPCVYSILYDGSFIKVQESIAPDNIENRYSEAEFVFGFICRNTIVDISRVVVAMINASLSLALMAMPLVETYFAFATSPVKFAEYSIGVAAVNVAVQGGFCIYAEYNEQLTEYDKKGFIISLAVLATSIINYRVLVEETNIAIRQYEYNESPLTRINESGTINIENTENLVISNDCAVAEKPLDTLPENVRSSFEGYSKHHWQGNYPGQVIPGVTRANAGGTYYNDHALLPGGGISYREFDVIAVPVGSPRGAERFVVGSNGAIYYTPDHYVTFYRIN